MPYSREKASKGGHSDLVKNPEVAEFLSGCNYMTQPNESQAKEIADSYLPTEPGPGLLDMVVASDASPYTKPVNGYFPSTQVGYVKASLVLVKVEDFDGLYSPNSRFVDPFKVAAVHRNADAFSFVLPGSNIRYGDAPSVKEGFRRAVWDQLSDDKTRFSQNDEFTVRGTLLALQNGEATLKKCPVCGEAHPDGARFDKFVFTKGTEVQSCPDCQSLVYLTDTLRIHEQVLDFGDCTSAITRFMNAVEHLLVATFVRMLAHEQPRTLSNMGFIIDGPLAIFGQPASLSFSLVKMYDKINRELADRDLLPPVIIGLQKDGQVMEHARSIEPFLKENSFRVVDDEYRNRHISSVNNANFGTETYFGQDFIFKSGPGRVFCVGIPYPFPSKSGSSEFSLKKANPSNYGVQLSRAFDLIRHFEFDLYQNAVVPIALAHRHASISLVPGGKVLDLVTKHGLSKA